MKYGHYCSWILKHCLASTCLCLLLVGNCSADSPEIHPFKRAIEYHDFPELGMRVTADLSPKWTVKLERNLTGKYHTVIASSPANYFPVAEMHFMHVPDYRMEDLTPNPDLSGTKPAVLRFLKIMGQRYQIPNNLMTLETLMAERYGNLAGFSLVAEGAANGAADIKLFLGQGELSAAPETGADSIGTQADGRGMIFIAVVTQVGTLPVLKHVIRRSWTNTGYLSEVGQ
jgi:hypothetical protein